MSLSMDRVLTNRPYRRTYGLSVPDYDSLVFEYKFDEGQATAGSMNNIIFDNRTPAIFGADTVTNPNFTGTYVAGVAPNWSVDAGVTATETTTSLGLPAQRVTNMNGVSQGLQGTSLTLVTGDIYVMSFTIALLAGTGNIQIQLAGLNGMTGTYDIASTVFPDTNDISFFFYGVAKATSSTLTITADAVGIDLRVSQFSVKAVGGGNHMVMDHNLYDESSRTNNSYDLNGTDQYFYIEDVRQSGLDFGSEPISIACISQAGTGSANTDLIAKNKNGTVSYSFRREASFVRLYVSSNGTTFQNFRSAVSSLPALSPTSFEYIAISYDTPNGLAKANYNGTDLAITYSTGPPLTVTTFFDSTYRATIGASFNALDVPANFHDGKVGRMLVWKGVSLTAQQHETVFNILRATYGI